MTALACLFLVALAVKHFLFDFVLQTPYQLANKGKYGHPGGLLHSGLHVLGTAAALAIVGPAPTVFLAILVAEFVVHYHIDWGKEQITARHGSGMDGFFWRMIGLDQLLHHLTYVAIAAALFLGGA